MRHHRYTIIPTASRHFAAASTRPLIAVLLLACGALTLQASTPVDHPHTEHDTTHHHKNHIALFIGATQAEEHHGERNDPHFTLGIDYERRLSTLFGLGLLADGVIGGKRDYLVGVPLFLHASEHIILQLAPAWHKVEEGNHSGAVLRTGIIWSIPVGTGTLSPSLFYDIAESDNIFVFGLSIGKGW